MSSIDGDTDRESSRVVPRTLEDVLERIERLDATLIPKIDSIYKDRQDGRYTDFSIICDDGTVFKAHKVIVCPQVAAIDAGLKQCFQEGQTNQYFLPEKKSSAVKAFLDLIYGDGWRQSSTWLDRENFTLKAQVYAIADELQADQIFSYVLKWFTLVLPRCIYFSPNGSFEGAFSAMTYIDENVNQRQEILTLFLNACEETVVATEGDHGLIHAWFRNTLQYRSNFLRTLLTISGSGLMKHFEGDCLDRIWKIDGVDAIIIEGCSGGRTVQLARLWELQGFRDAVIQEGLLKEVSAALVEEALKLADDVRAVADADRVILQKTMPLYWCSTCRRIIQSEAESTSQCPSCHNWVSYTVSTVVYTDKTGKMLREIKIKDS